ncbi:homeobox protein Hox-C13b [Rhinichthys klamathensis goyatoka]|uniref:homeobox protein Hox-C13b n=1 Tax=Rhinichthys klamathensis goyatoka TaxID=3034132 RepID=UPI0024B58C29|nr:homeobox protein Hox-C13b [Rhinichthys klamathensis goyatoka]
MEGLSGSCPASHCSDFIPHPALGRLSGNHRTVYSDIPAPQTSSGSSLSYGYPFGSPYYGCRLPYSHNVNLQQNPCSFHPGEKYVEPSGVQPSEELSSRSKEYAVYPSFASSYKSVPGYLDVPVIPGISARPESRHETLFPDSYQHWALSNGWDEQLYCSKEQTHFNYLWNSQFSDVMPHQTEMNGYRRGRKKRVPYTKIQLKELEKEYEASKFITKDKRRRICATTDLSERQVTIWFQNRRVKEKKFVCKPTPSKVIHAM